MSSSQQQQQQQELRLADTMRQRIQRLEEDNRLLNETSQSYKAKSADLERCMEQQHRDALAAIKQWQSDSYSLQQRNAELEALVHKMTDKVAATEEENRGLQKLTAQQTISLSNLQERLRTDTLSSEAAQSDIKDLQTRLAIAEKDAFQAHKQRETREGAEQQLEEDVRQLRTAVHQLEAQKTRMEMRLATVEDERDRWEKDCRDVLELNASLRSELHASSGSATVAFEKASKSVTQLEELSRQLSETRGELDAANHRLPQLEALCSELEGRKQQLTAELDSVREQMQVSDQAAENLLVAHESLKGELSLAQSALRQEATEHQASREATSGLTAENAQLKKQLDDLDSDLVEHLDTIEGLKRRVVALEEAVEAGERATGELDIRISEVTAEKELQCFRLLELERTHEAVVAEFTTHKADALSLSEVLMELQGAHEKLTATAERDATEVVKLREMLTETRASLATEARNAEALTIEHTAVVAERDELREGHANLTTQLSSMEAELASTKDNLEAWTLKATEAVAQVSALTSTNDALTVHRDALLQSEQQLQAQLSQTAADLEHWKTQHQELLVEMEAADRTMQMDVETFREARADMLRDNEALRDELKAVRERLESTAAELDVAHSEAKVRDIDLRALQLQVQEIEEAREALLEKQQTHVAEKHKLQQRVGDLEGSRTNSMRHVAEMNVEMESLRNQLKQSKLEQEISHATADRAILEVRERHEAEFNRRERAEELCDALKGRLHDCERERDRLEEAKAVLVIRVDELKKRCNNDLEKLDKLLEARRVASVDRDTLIAKYNALFDQHKELRQTLRKQNPNMSILNTSISSDPVIRQAVELQMQQAAMLQSAEQQIRSLCETCEQQETELTELRQHCQVLQLSIGKFLNASTVKAEELLADKSITVHALNTEEGPRRQPKRRPTTHIRVLPAFNTSVDSSDGSDNSSRKRPRADIVPLGEQHVNL